MAYCENLICTKCKEKYYGVASTSIFGKNLCSNCLREKQAELELAKEKELEDLKSLTIEERLARIEKCIQEQSKNKSIENDYWSNIDD